MFDHNAERQLGAYNFGLGQVGSFQFIDKRDKGSFLLSKSEHESNIRKSWLLFSGTIPSINKGKYQGKNGVRFHLVET